MKFQFSLKELLLISIICATTLPILLLGLLELNVATNALKNEVETKNTLLANSARQEINRILSFSEKSLNFFVAHINSLQAVGKEHISGELDLLINKYDLFESVLVLNKNGEVVYSAPNNQTGTGIKNSEQEFFRIPANQNQIYWSEVFISEYYDLPTVSLSVPTDDGVVVGYFDLVDLSSIIGEMTIGNDGYVTITDHSGTIIADHDKSKITRRINISNLEPIKHGMKGESGIYYYNDAGKYIGVVSVVEPTNWIILVSQPENEAFSLLRQTRLVLVLIIFIAWLLAITIAFLSLNLIIRPFSFFITATKDIANGKYKNIYLPYRYKEIDEMATTFVKMGKAIEEREHRLQESEERYKLLFENNADGIIVVDSDTHEFLYINPTICRMLGYSLQELLKMSFSDIHPEDSLNTLKKAFSGIDTEVDLTTKDFRCLTKSKEAITVDIRISQILINKKICYICIYRDITERKIIQQLEKEKMVHEKMVLEFQRTTVLGNLASALAHEIRQPLHTIRIITDGIINQEKQQEFLTHDNGKRLDNLSRIIRGIDRINNAVDYIYNHTNHPAEIIIESIDINAVIAETIDFFKAQLNYYQIKTVFIPDPDNTYLIFSKIKAEHVLSNLLNNAIKAVKQNHSGEKIITIKTIKTDDIFLLEISDTGPGISDEIKDEIFKPLFSQNSDKDSLGMGLYIVKNILDAYNAKIQVSDSVSGGAAFRIKLNLSKEDYEHSAD